MYTVFVCNLNILNVIIGINGERRREFRSQMSKTASFPMQKYKRATRET